MLELLIDYFEAQGIEVAAADGAEEALELLNSGSPPDVILMDLRMPKVSGEELLEQLRANLVWAGIPVAVMSGDSSRLAFTGRPEVPTLAKPFSIDELVAVLSQHCSNLSYDASP